MRRFLNITMTNLTAADVNDIHVKKNIEKKCHGKYMLVSLFHESWYICILILYAKCSSYYGTVLSYTLCPIIIVTLALTFYTLYVVIIMGTLVISYNLLPIIMFTLALIFYTLTAAIIMGQ